MITKTNDGKIKIMLPLTDDDIKELHAGDSVLISGSLITGRDAAHKRLYELIEKGEKLPVNIKGEVIYYGRICISCNTGSCIKWKCCIYKHSS